MQPPAGMLFVIPMEQADSRRQQARTKINRQLLLLSSL